MHSAVARRDIGGQVAQNGFKWIFVLNGHVAPAHSIALNEGSDFVSDTFHVTMLHLTGLFRADPAIQARGDKMKARFFTKAALDSFGMDVHAGVGETAGMLAVRPDLVRPIYKTRGAIRAIPTGYRRLWCRFEKTLAHEAAFEAKLAAWLAERRKGR